MADAAKDQCSTASPADDGHVEDGPLFPDLSANQALTEIESMCVQCHHTVANSDYSIPHFKDIIISAFECPHCGYHNNDTQSAAAIGEKGCRITCLITDAKDLNRQLVKSEYAVIKIEEADFEVPATLSRGYLTTVEGLLRRAIEDLQTGQPRRQVEEADLYEKIEAILSRLNAFLENRHKFSIVLDDPSGNSYIENICLPKADPKIKTLYYRRSPEQLEAMGYSPSMEEAEADSSIANEDNAVDTPLDRHEIFSFAANCCACSTPCETRMHMLEIPYFKEVVIMSTTCDACGYKTNEVKSGGAISEKGKRIILHMTTIEDLSRDILKSETCSMEIPEIELQLQMGTLGGRFTTVEGLLTQVHDELQSRVPFAAGDSVESERKGSFDRLLSNLKKICNNELHCTLIIDDPLANSYLQNLYAPDPDPNMTIQHYERSFEQNDDLGINDMKVEGYEQQ